MAYTPRGAANGYGVPAYSLIERPLLKICVGCMLGGSVWRLRIAGGAGIVSMCNRGVCIVRNSFAVLGSVVLH